MSRRLNITTARSQFLSLPEKLAPGEVIDIVRHRKTVLRIVRPDERGEAAPFYLLDRAVDHLKKTRRRPPRTLAARYKDYLYGKKR